MFRQTGLLPLVADEVRQLTDTPRPLALVYHSPVFSIDAQGS